MAGVKFTDLPLLGETPAPEDILCIVDVSDTSESAEGTSKAVAYSDVVGYKEYVALLTQTGTDAPTAEVLSNTLGFTPVFARVSQGVYTMSQEDGFPIGKTFFIINSSMTETDGTIFFLIGYETTPSPDRLKIESYQPVASFTDDRLLNTPIQIRVYP